MPIGEPSSDDSWEMNDDGRCVNYTGSHGSLTLERNPLRFVAPLMEASDSRNVYLPSGLWIDWREIELRVFAADSSTARGILWRPEDGELHTLRLAREGGGFILDQVPLSDVVSWSVCVCP